VGCHLVDISVVIPIWRKHLIICLFFGLLALPIYFMDLASMGDGGGGNWIALDFRGLIFWTYITLLAIDVVVSSIAVFSFPKAGVLRIHFWSMVLSVILLVTGVVVYGKLLRAQAISSRSGDLNRETAESIEPVHKTAATLSTKSERVVEAGAGIEPANRFTLENLSYLAMY